MNAIRWLSNLTKSETDKTCIKKTAVGEAELIAERIAVYIYCLCQKCFCKDSSLLCTRMLISTEYVAVH
jgi:hypothetical protein